MNSLHQLSRLPRTAWLLPLLLLVGCPSGTDSHEGHNHEAGQESEDHGDESHDEHAGHDHDEESSK
jgi:hypothetical protein